MYTNGCKQIKNFQCVCNTAYHDRGIKLERLTKGVIYQLRFGHPVIDGVGLLQDENEKSYVPGFYSGFNLTLSGSQSESP